MQAIASASKFSAKAYVKSKLPGLANLKRELERSVSAVRWNLFVRPRLQMMSSLESVFHWHFEQGTWSRDAGSVSGAGSDVDVTDALREGLRRLIEEYQVKSLLDIPCGDGEWMSRAELPADLDYIGADIVAELVEMNKRNRGETANRKFRRLDITRDELPRADLIFCRDCLGHFSNALVLQTLRNLKRAGAKYLATTTFPKRENEKDIVTGDWRPINLQARPFFLREPLSLIREDSIGPPFADKSIGLWRTSDLPVQAG